MYWLYQLNLHSQLVSKALQAVMLTDSKLCVFPSIGPPKIPLVPEHHKAKLVAWGRSCLHCRPVRIPVQFTGTKFGNVMHLWHAS